MTTRRHYLISYDISDDKRRTKVFDALMGRGDWTQYSVFLCQLNPRELAELQGDLAPLINAAQDQVLFVDLGPAHNMIDEVVRWMGKPLGIRSRVTIV